MTTGRINQIASPLFPREQGRRSGRAHRFVRKVNRLTTRSPISPLQAGPSTRNTRYLTVDTQDQQSDLSENHRPLTGPQYCPDSKHADLGRAATRLPLMAALPTAPIYSAGVLDSIGCKIIGGSEDAESAGA